MWIFFGLAEADFLLVLLGRLFIYVSSVFRDSMLFMSLLKFWRKEMEPPPEALLVLAPYFFLLTESMPSGVCTFLVWFFIYLRGTESRFSDCVLSDLIPKAPCVDLAVFMISSSSLLSDAIFFKT